MSLGCDKGDFCMIDRHVTAIIILSTRSQQADSVFIYHYSILCITKIINITAHKQLAQTIWLYNTRIVTSAAIHID